MKTDQNPMPMYARISLSASEFTRLMAWYGEIAYLDNFSKA
jgi:hypothetical protein